MDSRDEAEARITAIETKLAFLEDFVTKLQQEVVERGATFDRLAAEQKAIRTKLVEVAEELEEIPNRKPPHY